MSGLPSSLVSLSPKFISLALNSATVMNPVFCLSAINIAKRISFLGSSFCICLYMTVRKVEKSSSAVLSGNEKRGSLQYTSLGQSDLTLPPWKCHFCLLLNNGYRTGWSGENLEKGSFLRTQASCNLHFFCAFHHKRESAFAHPYTPMERTESYWPPKRGLSGPCYNETNE